jgi:hypothetical protein
MKTYLRQRQRPPIHTDFLFSIIERCQVTREIAEEITRSMAKGERLAVKEVRGPSEPVIFQISDVKANGRILIFDTDTIGLTCSCAKFETMGSPCSPICAVLRVNGGLDEVKSLVHDRWKIGDAHSRQEASKLPASIVEDPNPRVLAAAMGPPEKHKQPPS